MHIESTLLLQAIKERLDALSAELVQNISCLGQGESNNRIKGLNFDAVETLHFEYSYDDLQLYYWEEGSQEQVLSRAVVKLPTTQTEGLLTLALRDRIVELEDVLYEDKSVEEDAVEEEVEQFNEARCTLFEQWFLDCWALARKQMSGDKQGYFSIHDSYYKTKLE